MSNKDLAELERLLHLYQQERNANRVNTTISTSQQIKCSLSLHRQPHTH